MTNNNFHKMFVVAVLLFGRIPALAADELQSAVAELQHGWAMVLYQTPKNHKEAAYLALSSRARQAAERFPGRVEPMVWQAIVLSSYAEYENGLSALGKLKTAKELLLAAEKIDPAAMHGTIPMVLGVIHYKAPGWPLSFGDDRKAQEYLQAALRSNPDGMDQNFYYGEFLLQLHDDAKASSYLKKALAAEPRVGREDADSGRKAEIERMLQSIARK
ncbi:MAG: hypothetical protein WA632_13905 [Gallionella sp.]